MTRIPTSHSRAAQLPARTLVLAAALAVSASAFADGQAHPAWQARLQGQAIAGSGPAVTPRALSRASIRPAASSPSRASSL